MSDGIIRIPVKDMRRGEDGYKVFSIRVPNDAVAALDELALKSNRSRNALINMFIEWGIAHAEVDD